MCIRFNVALKYVTSTPLTITHVALYHIHALYKDLYIDICVNEKNVKINISYLNKLKAPGLFASVIDSKNYLRGLSTSPSIDRYEEAAGRFRRRNLLDL